MKYNFMQDEIKPVWGQNEHRRNSEKTEIDFFEFSDSSFLIFDSSFLIFGSISDNFS